MMIRHMRRGESDVALRWIAVATKDITYYIYVCIAMGDICDSHGKIYCTSRRAIWNRKRGIDFRFVRHIRSYGCETESCSHFFSGNRKFLGRAKYLLE